MNDPLEDYGVESADNLFARAAGPDLDPESAEEFVRIMDEIVADRAHDFGRPVEFDFNEDGTSDGR
ncbi:hypothetical protein [Microbacterium sp.]|uniref:hypothetical protein n=1 Tax=Microbacterium sp. TaxID=51671 RepID=UPI003F9EA002